MNLIGYVQMEIVKDTRKYVFSMPWGAPFSECHEVAAQLVQEVIDLQKQEESKLKAQQEQSEPLDAEIIS